MVQRKKIRVYLRERILRLPLNLKKYSIFWKIKLFLKRLAGRELWLTEDVKLKTRFHGDWEYYPDYLNKDSVIYSLGVGDSIDFDIGLINDHDSNVHAFDPTPYSVDWIEHQNIPSKLVFHPWAVSSKDGSMKMMQRVNKTGKISDVIFKNGEKKLGKRSMSTSIIKLIENDCGESLRSKGFPESLIDLDKKKKAIEVNND